MKYVSLILMGFLTACNAPTANQMANQQLVTAAPTVVCDPTATNIGGGDGSESNPYLICSANQFIQVGSMGVPGKHYLLTTDIDISSVGNTNGWTAGEIVVEGEVLDGGGHSVSNLPSETNVWIQISGTVKNINIVNAAAPVGKAFIVGTLDIDGVIDTVNISGNDVGLALTQNGTITNCTAN